MRLAPYRNINVIKKERIKKYDWNSDLKIGLKNEDYVISHPIFKNIGAKKNPDKMGPDIWTEKGFFELKTEARFTTKHNLAKDNIRFTKNLFIERWSKYEKKELGGPWQAKNKGSKFIAHFFPLENIIYIFELELLVNFLDSLINKGDLLECNFSSMNNIKWVTKGWPVSIKLLCENVPVEIIDLNKEVLLNV